MNKKGYRIAHEASNVISDEYIGLLDRDEYNSAISHVCELIRAAYTLFKANSFAPSVFLSITVFEEIAKIKAGHMRSWGEDRDYVKRHKDSLFQHKLKHKITVDSFYNCERISNSIGKDRSIEFFSKYESGEYSSFREESLYFSRNKHELHIPSEKIGLRLAAEHLLIAIEIFSDEFWGMSGEASKICDTTNDLYSNVESVLKNS